MSTEAFAVCYDPPNSHTYQSTNVVPGVAATCLRHRRRRPHAHIHRPEWRCCTDSGYHCSVLFRISKRVVRTRPSVFVPVMFTLTTRSTPQPPLLCCIRRSPPGSNLERIGPCARVCVCVCVCWLVYWKRRCRRRPRNAQLASFTGVFFRRLFAKGGINRSRRTKAESLIDSYGE
jgi:hypothetical protein